MDPEATGAISFTRDGSAIAYLVRRGEAVTPHIQPLDGSAPRVIAASNDDVGAVGSPDGLHIAVLRISPSLESTTCELSGL